MPIPERFSEHLSEPKLHTHTGAEHVMNEDHGVNSCNENFDLLQRCKKASMDFLESLEI